MRVLLVLLALTTAGLAAVLVEVTLRPEITTVEIDRDRETINTQLKEAQTEAAKYSGGVIKTFIDLRIEILRNTLAMLDQKRSSYLRLITLRFTVDGRPFSATSDAQLREIEEEIKQVERKVADAKREVSQYSGGLLQTMALVKVATEEASASTLSQNAHKKKALCNTSRKRCAVRSSTTRAKACPGTWALKGWPPPRPLLQPMVCTRRSFGGMSCF